jgi:hypothetical protein
MVELDTQLIRDARQFCTDTNLKYVLQLITWYEDAVRESAEGGTYKPQFEEWLRAFVAAEREYGRR